MRDSAEIPVASSRTELATRILCSLLARDPLAAQRFTEIGQRLEQLAHLAEQCAETFLRVDAQWQASPEQARAAAQRAWDYHARPAGETPVPKALQGAAGPERPGLF